MRNPWLAIDATTPPARRAREVRRAWEAFQGGDCPDSVRAPIAESWQRSSEAGVDPSRAGSAPLVADGDEAAARWEAHPLLAAAPLIKECLASIADDAAHLMVVSDADGTLLWLEGAPSVRLAASDSMNFSIGALWSEGGAGTNAIGTALAADHAVQVFAAEHFNEVVQAWTCAAAPVHDPDTSELLGVIDLTGRMRTVHPHSFAVAVATAGAVEAHLRVGLHERDARLRARYGDRVLEGRGPRALVTASGRVIVARPDGWLGGDRIAVPPWGGPLTVPGGTAAFAEPLEHGGGFLLRRLDGLAGAREGAVVGLQVLGRDHGRVTVGGRSVEVGRRHAEILALLALHPGGYSTEELRQALYGDRAGTSSVRGEVSRLRKLLGVPIETEPYRLAVPVQSDAGAVQALLRRGRVREAAERYGGQLLPGSDAPGVCRERDALDGWVRHAVMTGGDLEALWAWVGSHAGDDDIPAWKLALSSMDFHDPRRSQAAAQLARLRADVRTP
jgi:hypothetical protein